jgi:predicted secreted hydrolase
MGWRIPAGCAVNHFGAARLRWSAALLFLSAAVLGAWRFPFYRAQGPATSPDYAALMKVWQDRTADAYARPDENAGPLSFPLDHAGHPAFPAEQWDFAALLDSVDGARRFALRFRLDRLGAADNNANRGSRWAAREFFHGMQTLTDFAAERFSPDERYSRRALGLSGYDTDPPRVWIDADALEWTGGRAADGQGKLAVSGRETIAQLYYVPLKPVASFDPGAQTAGPWRGYVYPRMRVTGNLQTGGRVSAVTGSGWLGHGWGRLPPVGGQVAFNRWFIQLSDDTELAVLQLRRRDGSGRPSIEGVSFGAAGEVRRLEQEDFELSPGQHAGRYPLSWVLSLPGAQIELRIRAVLQHQESTGAAGTWDGAVIAEGRRGGSELSGWGFMELNGY